MQNMDQILGSSGIDVAALGARFGLSRQQTMAAIESLMPAVAGGFQKRAETGDLAEVGAVASGIGQPDTDSGNQILGQIFGSKDVSRQVAGHAAGEAGLSSTVMKALLPIVAAIVARHFAKSGGLSGSGDQGGLGGLLGSILGGGQGGAAGQPGGFGSGGANPLEAILGELAGRR